MECRGSGPLRRHHRSWAHHIDRCVFPLQLFGYNITGARRWVSLNLRKKKKQGGAGGKKKREKAAAIAAAKAAEIEARVREQQEEQEEEARQAAAAAESRDSSDDEEDEEDENRPPVDYEARFKQQASAAPAAVAAAAAPVAPSKSAPGSTAVSATSAPASKPSAPQQPTEEDLDEDPDLSRPLSRFNAMLAVQRNVLYLYGGIHETASREYTLDDFHVLQLDKMERWVSLKECRIEGLEWNESDEEDESDTESESGSDSSSSDEGENDTAAAQEGEEVQSLHSHSDHEGDGADEDASPEEVAARLAKQEQVKEQARQAYGVLKGGAAAAGGEASAELSEEERQRTPNPGETLRMFFDRTREYWARRAFESSHGEVRGKEMRTKGFEVSPRAKNLQWYRVNSDRLG